MLNLLVPDPNTESGMIPVSWCVNGDLLKMLADEGIKDPHVLLVTAPQGSGYHQSKETRKLVPLTDGMSYVDFHTDGPHRIFAILMFWWSDIKNIHEFIFARQDGSWKATLLTYDGSTPSNSLNARYRNLDVYSGWGITRLPEAERQESDKTDDWRAIWTSIDVIVPKGVFAKPSPKWEAPWVNHWFRNPPVDQCDYRQRRLWAYSVQPPVMLLNWLLRLVVTIFVLLAGFKQINWKPVLHLLSKSVFDTLDSFENGNYFWPESWDRNRVGFVARTGLPVFTPLSLITIGGISYALGDSVSDSFLTFLSILMCVAIGIPLLTLVVCGIRHIALASLSSWYVKPSRPVVVYYLQSDTAEFLSCETLKGTPRTLGKIPWRRRSVRLIFNATKAAVCRPFAR